MTDAINSDPLLLAQQAVNSVREMFPAGPWCVTTIDPHDKNPKKPLPTRTFMPGQEDALRDHIQQWDGRVNIYLHVNITPPKFSRRAGEVEIVAARALFIDIDPPEGTTDIPTWQTEVRGILHHVPEAVVQKPTRILDSGAGFQLLYTLDTPVELNGDRSRIDDFKRYGRQLQSTFEMIVQAKGKVDSCFNIDRLCRFPGTLNIPDDKKLVKHPGRVAARGKLLKHMGSAQSYELKSFKQVPLPVRAASILATTSIKAGQELRFLTSVDELDVYGVDDATKRIIVQGSDPMGVEKPGKDTSRSGWQWHATCQLARKGVPDEVILAILLDPGFGISESVRDKPNPEAHAIRQVEKSKETALNPKLAEMNEQYAVVVLGSKTRVARWGPSKLDAGKTQVIHLQEFGEFKNALMNEQVEVGLDKDNRPTWKPIAPWWLGHARRRQYLGGMLYAPGQGRDLDGGFLNLFTGWGVEPAPGDWSLMQAHILSVIAQGNADHALYITRWCAWAVQHPAERAGVALVLQGKKGTGKGAFAEAMVRLFGRHGRIVLQQEHVVGKFNSHLEYCSLLFADEAFAANQKQAESVLKGIVTSPTLEIEGKGRDTEQARNCLHIILASNDQWVVPATQDERRWAVFTMSDEHAKDEAYFAPLFAQMESGGHAAMLHDLLAMSLGDWHPRRDIPETDALAMQKQLTLRGTDRVMYQMLASGSPVGCVAQDAEGNRFISTSVLVEKHDDLGEKDRHSIGTQLKMASEDTSSGAPRLRAGGVPHRGRWLPVLERARYLWALRKGLAIQWPADPFEWQGDVEQVERALDQGVEPGSEVPF